MRRRSMKWLAVGVVVGALALSGCSNSSSGGSNTAEKTLISAVGDNPPNFNRYLGTGASTVIIGSGTFYEGLTQLDANYKPVPLLAKSWTVSADGLVYTFKLQDGITSQDGKPFTSADVKFDFEKLMPLSAQLAPITKQINSVETPDATTVVVNFKTPYAPFLSALAGAWMIPEHIFTTKDIATDPANMKPIGTGPYKLDSFTPGDKAVLSRYDGYWGQKGDVNKIIFKVMPDTSARMLALQSGDIDYLYGAYVDKAQQAQLNKSKFDLPDVLGGKGSETVFFNTEREVVSNPQVRRAIYQAIDKQAIVDKALFGLGDAARGPIPKAFSQLIDGSVDFTKELPYSSSAAAAALDQAGYKADSSGNRFTLRLAFDSTQAVYSAIANLIQANLKAVGITVQLEALDSKVWVDKTYTKRDFDMSLNGFFTFEDPSIGTTRLYTCNAGKVPYKNASGTCDNVIDDAFTKAGQVTDPTERAKYFAIAEKRILETMPSMPLVSLNGYSVVDKKFNMDAANAVSSTAWATIRSR
ncbi:ABC transporter substrate-binding protein [Arthrobacter sp. FW306-2-2C-D06B]|uniref:ABC transporter substrate-binding protein n=1 Tax=Arthrobacter sp. FW306-2-2C-D06B TaxID=2879618 RepID=UPI001F1D381E|nr:ABC transporter substrate-binding protein [Arthrobacter sp. FW306-2-2C-D06B]UKA60475.1 ABC transporter substrate-binding protein [Arthrobacter sp. FW306-2-2C-D06B]